MEDRGWRKIFTAAISSYDLLSSILHPRPSQETRGQSTFSSRRREFRQSTSSLTAIAVLDGFNRVEKSRPDLSIAVDPFSIAQLRFPVPLFS